MGGKTVTIGAIAKGSGMIHPNMGTMLCFLTTDCAISSDVLQDALYEVTKVTFNRVSVDGDTSTSRSYCRPFISMVKPNGVTNQLRGLPSACFTPRWAYTASKRASTSSATRPMWETSPE